MERVDEMVSTKRGRLAATYKRFQPVKLFRINQPNAFCTLNKRCHTYHIIDRIIIRVHGACVMLCMCVLKYKHSMVDKYKLTQSNSWGKQNTNVATTSQTTILSGFIAPSFSTLSLYHYLCPCLHFAHCLWFKIHSRRSYNGSNINKTISTI